MGQIESDQEKVEVFENDMDLYLRLFCEENGIEDMTKEPQSRWNAALMYIKRHVFSDKSVLKSNNIQSRINNPIKSNYNAYNYSLLLDICNYYIYLCSVYDKEVSLNGFSFLTGINTDTLIDWGNGSTKLTTLSCEIYKNLSRANEESLEAKLATGNKNPVGVIAILNRRHGWNSPYCSNSQPKQASLTASELPKLGNELHENDTQLSIPELKSDV